MLGKLFKHEMHATARTFIWLYLAFVVIAVANAILVSWSPVDGGGALPMAAPQITTEADMAMPIPAAIRGLLIMLYILAVLAIAAVTFVVVIIRFYRNLLGDEGYLMMTLPVSREKHMLSKLLSALIWTVCSFILIFLSLLMFVASSGNFESFAEGINSLASTGAPIVRWAAMFILTLVVACASGILMLYASMTVGPNLLKNRLGGSILAFIIISIASQIVSFAVFMIWTRGLTGSGFSQAGIIQASATNPGGAGVPSDEATNVMLQVNPIIDVVITGAIISFAIIGISCWFLTRYMLKKKLNLA